MLIYIYELFLLQYGVLLFQSFNFSLMRLFIAIPTFTVLLKLSVQSKLNIFVCNLC